MDLSAYEDTYTSEVEVADVGFLSGVIQYLKDNKQDFRSFFVGQCYYCNVRSHGDLQLQRCGGCQLVGYCSRICQKKDWSSHKSVCKEFPLVEGKNVLYTNGSWRKHLSGLRKQAAHLPDARPIFQNSRVCNICRESCPDRLTDCMCMCVSYCSKGCINADRLHENYCGPLNRIAWTYYFHNQRRVQDVEQNMPMDCYMTVQEIGMKTPFDIYNIAFDSVCSKFTPIYNYNELLNDTKMANEIKHISERHIEGESASKELTYTGIVINHLAIYLLSYPMSLLYALQCLTERRLGLDHHPLEDLTTLDIHVVTSSPLFHTEPWELFMHYLPCLQNLNIVFVMQGKAVKQSFNLNLSVKSNLRRCQDCEAKNRIIIYSMKQEHYHMFFSSLDYKRPDVVVVYENEYEMSCKDGDVHSEISFSNMIHSHDIVLVLMDATKDKVINGVKAVNAVQPVKQVVRPQENPLKGVGANRSEMGSKVNIDEVNHFFACLKKK